MPKAKKRVHKKILTFYRERPRRWIKGNLANGEGGYCLLGAIEKIYGSTGHGSIRSKISNTIQVLFPSRRGIINFNDTYQTRFKDVMKVLRKANV